MGKLWMHARANIRKSKSVSVTLVVMFLIAALLLNMGLLVAINYGSFFSSLKQELSPADAYYAIPGAIYSDEVKSYIDSNQHVKKTQANNALWLSSRVVTGGEEKSHTILFQNMDEKREISKWKYVGEYLP